MNVKMDKDVRSMRGNVDFTNFGIFELILIVEFFFFLNAKVFPVKYCFIANSTQFVIREEMLTTNDERTLFWIRRNFLLHLTLNENMCAKRN